MLLWMMSLGLIIFIIARVSKKTIPQIIVYTITKYNQNVCPYSPLHAKLERGKKSAKKKRKYFIQNF